ncbi:MAG: phosphate ABC transporter permease subunit PstC [Defluviitaleaceae bacterium]|nr:phosphate ABC transporter permease subunit PstC [Defluviitaleaceae bacterium]
MDVEIKLTKKRAFSEKLFHALFLSAGLFAVICVTAIIILIFTRGSRPFMPGNEYGTYHFFNFLTGTFWRPAFGEYGVGYMIIASLFATFGAMLLGVPIGILTAVFIAEVAPSWLAKIMQPTVELLAAIPSVLYGVFGFAVIVPMINNFTPNPTGYSLMAVILVLTIMVLPSIVAISVTSLRAVPTHYKEGSLALGASHIQTIFKVLIPGAKSGILTAVVLGVGRAIGETMAVILVAGNPESGVPTSIFDPVRLLTTNIVLEQGYATGLQAQMLFATVIVLFTFILAINLTLSKIRKKAVRI